MIWTQHKIVSDQGLQIEQRGVVQTSVENSKLKTFNWTQKTNEFEGKAVGIGDARGVENRGVRYLVGGDVLEDDLPLLFFRELLVLHRSVAE